MGNFYCNVTVRAPAFAVVDTLRQLQLPSLVAVEDAFAVVVDRNSEDQGFDALASVALTLSHRLNVPALAAMNHDDDLLLLGLYEHGKLTGEYGWGRFPGVTLPRTPRRDFVAQVRKAFGSVAGPPPQQHPHAASSWKGRLLMRMAPLIFAVEQHRLITAEMGLPQAAVGAGYRYALAGDLGHLSAFQHAWPKPPNSV